MVETSRSMPSRAKLSLWRLSWLVMAVFGVEDHCQQAGAGATAGNGVEWCGRLGDLLAAAAGELVNFLAHRLHHLP
jgi:hypothetical protein